MASAVPCSTWVFCNLHQAHLPYLQSPGDQKHLFHRALCGEEESWLHCRILFSVVTHSGCQGSPGGACSHTKARHKLSLCSHLFMHTRPPIHFRCSHSLSQCLVKWKGSLLSNVKWIFIAHCQRPEIHPSLVYLFTDPHYCSSML